MISNLFITFLNMTISATLGAILLITVRRLTKKYIPYKYYYILWGVIFLRFTIPVSYTSAFSLVGLLKPAQAKTVGNGYVVTMEYLDAAGLNQAADSLGHSNLLSVVSRIWLAVATGLIVLWFVLYFRTQKRLEYAVKLSSPTAETVKRKLNTKVKFGVFTSANVLSPVVMGFIRPRIILPKNMQDSPEETECILAHEIIHLKRKDGFIKAFVYFISAVHWYNPMVWICFYLFNEDMEYSCDRELLESYGTGYKKHYANTLITYGQRNRGLHTGYIALAQSKVAGRINRILLHRKPPLVQRLAFYTVTVFIGLTVSANPVLRESYTYVPKTQIVDTSTKNRLKAFANSFVADMDAGDFGEMVNKATADSGYFSPLYTQWQGKKIPVQVDKVFYTSSDSAVVYLDLVGDNSLFPQGTHRLVLDISSSSATDGFYAESIHDWAKYEAIHTVDETNEAVMLRRKMIKYGLISGENTPENSEKIAMFCMDIAFDRQTGDSLKLTADSVENVAKEFFEISDFSNMENTKFYNAETDSYIFDKSLGNRYEYRITDLETHTDGRWVTVEFYKDPLQLQTEKIIKYKFRKVN